MTVDTKLSAQLKLTRKVMVLGSANRVTMASAAISRLGGPCVSNSSAVSRADRLSRIEGSGSFSARTESKSGSSTGWTAEPSSTATGTGGTFSRSSSL